jgi:3D (Asp-Asp-Asp) domain-containing protein
MPIWRALIAIAFLVGCSDDAAIETTPDAMPMMPTPDAGPGDPGVTLGSFQLTYYYVPSEADYTGADDTNVYDASCNVLAVVPYNFAQSLSIEGTGRLLDGEVINYVGSCHCPTATDTTTCYAPVDANHPWGSGAHNRPLVPFRSIAVDTTVLTIGHKYWIEELAGQKMPGDATDGGGFVHDGCVTADDTGGHILGMHVDFFSALRAYYLTLDKQLGMITHVTLHEGGARCP